MLKINLEIYTKDKKIFKGLGDSINIDINNESKITILPNHIPIITFVNNTLLIFSNNSVKKNFILGKGFFKFNENLATVIVDCIKK